MKTNRKNKGKYTIHFIILSLLMSVIIISCGGCGGVKDVTLANANKKAVDSVANSTNTKNERISSTDFDLGILKNAPSLPLEDADIKEVFDHYILQDTASNQKYHFYDGKKQQTVDFSEPDVHLRVSRNEMYLSKMKLVENKMSTQYFLDIELRDAGNKVIAKQSIPSAYEDYYDEFRDEIIPLEDGSGFLQVGRRLGLSCFVTGYKLVGTKFIKKFQIDKSDSFLDGIKANEDGSKIVIKYNTKTQNNEKDTLVLYNLEKGLIWKKELPDLGFGLYHYHEKSTFYNEQDIYLFKNGIDIGKVLRYNFDGKIIDSIDVSGNFQSWDFIDSKIGEVLLINSNKFLYMYHTKTKDINKIDLYEVLKIKGNATIWIRNAIFSKQSENDIENLIFTVIIDAHPKDKIFFSGVMCYNDKGKTIKAFQSTPLYGKLSRKGRDIFLQGQLSSYFSGKMMKIDLNKIK